jgi:UDP-GlcNAc:undecaprenyl-phosphate GlcNAc-1-phosphate transferase
VSENAVFAGLVFLGATTLSALLVPFSRTLGRWLGILDPPGERKLHEVAVPRIGGVAVFLAATVVITGGLLAPTLSRYLDTRDLFPQALRMLRDASRVRTELIAVLSGSALVFLIGLLDDILGVRFPVGVKTAGQIFAAGILVSVGIHTTVFPGAGLNILVTVLWVVGITNAFNLLDNMDGLSAGVAFVASSVLLMNAWSHGEFFISLIQLAFMGSLLGFLFFNFSFRGRPASVFLGDCGSLFIGYFMASLTLLERYVSKGSSNLFPVLMPVVVLAVPVIDTFTVIAIRTRSGKAIWRGDNNHLSHRLVALGFSRPTTVLFIYLATFCLGTSALFLRDATPWQTLVLLLQSGGFVALLLLLMFIRRPA